MSLNLRAYDLKEAFRLGTLARPTVVDSRFIDGGEVWNVEMPSLDLSFTRVERATFTDCDLLDGRFHKSSFNNCTFQSCRFERFRFFELDIESCRFENVWFGRCEMEEISAWNSSFDDVAFGSGRVGPNSFFECTFEGLHVRDMEVTGRAGYARFSGRPKKETRVALERLGMAIEIDDRN